MGTYLVRVIGELIFWSLVTHTWASLMGVSIGMMLCGHASEFLARKSVESG